MLKAIPNAIDFFGLFPVAKGYKGISNFKNPGTDFPEKVF